MTPLADKLSHINLKYKDGTRVEYALKSRIRGRLHVLIIEGIAHDLASAHWPGDYVLK